MIFCPTINRRKKVCVVSPDATTYIWNKIYRLTPKTDTTEDKLLETIIRQMAEAQGVNEELKARDQMAWVGAMNNIKSAALEILRESK